MTPDMKRLCEAVMAAHDDWFREPDSITPAGAEAIVRAVLMALPDIEGGDRYAAGEWSRRNADAMISDILAEPAKA